jgi:hypothetical protein
MRSITSEETLMHYFLPMAFIVMTISFGFTLKQLKKYSYTKAIPRKIEELQAALKLLRDCQSSSTATHLGDLPYGLRADHYIVIGDILNSQLPDDQKREAKRTYIENAITSCMVETDALKAALKVLQRPLPKIRRRHYL